MLLDEVDKAHADVLNALLQVLDDGRLTGAAKDWLEDPVALALLDGRLAEGSTVKADIGMDGTLQIR